MAVGDEHRAIDERTLHVALAVAPHVAEQHEMPGVEHAELERIDLARERAHGDFDLRCVRVGFASAAASASGRLGDERFLDALLPLFRGDARALLERTAAPALPHSRRPAARPRPSRSARCGRSRASVARSAQRRPARSAAARRSKPGLRGRWRRGSRLAATSRSSCRARSRRAPGAARRVSSREPRTS